MKGLKATQRIHRGAIEVAALIGSHRCNVRRSGQALFVNRPDCGANLYRCFLAPIRKNNRGISGVERLSTPVAGILIVGLQLH